MLRIKNLQEELNALNMHSEEGNPVKVKLITYAANTGRASYYIFPTKEGNEMEGLHLILTDDEHAEIRAANFFKELYKGLGSTTTEKLPVAELIVAIRNNKINNILKPNTSPLASRNTSRLALLVLVVLGSSLIISFYNEIRLDCRRTK